VRRVQVVCAIATIGAIDGYEDDMGPSMLAGKQFYRDRLRQIRDKRAALPTDGFVASLLSDELLAQINANIERMTPQDLAWDTWRPLIIAIAQKLDTQALLTFDIDLARVLAVTDEHHRQSLTSCLRDERASEFDHGQGTLFEFAVKARLLDHDINVEFDHKLKNGRDVDARLKLPSGTEVFIECTVLNTSCEDKRHLRDHYQSKKSDPKATSFQEIDFPKKTRRIFQKVLDKVAIGMDPTKTQLSASFPNLVLLSMVSPQDASADHFTTAWALAQLLDEHDPKGFTADSQLASFLEHFGAVLIQAGRLSQSELPSRIKSIHDALRSLTGILMFDKHLWRYSRENERAHPHQQLEDEEWREIIDLLQPLPDWYRCL
jgi:hypothetical protein